MREPPAPRLVSLRGQFQNCRQASPPFLYSSSPPPPREGLHLSSLSSPQRLLGRPVPIVLVKCWNVAH